MAVVNCTASGNWSNPATWGGNPPPGVAGDTNYAKIGLNFQVFMDVDVVLGDYPNDVTTIVLDVGSQSTNSTTSLTIPAWVTCKLRGKMRLGRATLNLYGVIEIDSSGAANPALNYRCDWVGGITTRINVIGTDANNRAEIRTKPGSAYAFLDASGGDSANYTTNWARFKDLGSTGTTVRAIKMDGPTTFPFVQTFEDTIFDSCGVVGWVFAPGQQAGFLFRNCEFINPRGTYDLQVSGAARPTATRLIERCKFRGFVQINGNKAQYKKCSLAQGFTVGSGPQWWDTFEDCYLGIPDNNGHTLLGSIKRSILDFRYWLPSVLSSPIETNTATAGTTTTVTVTGANWPTTPVPKFQSDASGLCITILFLTGANAGRYRMTVTNTSSVITLDQPLPFPVQAGDQFVVYSGKGNPHYVSAGHAALKGVAVVSSTLSTITVNNGVLVVNDGFADYQGVVTEGKGAGNTFAVSTNTASGVITLVGTLTETLDSTSKIDLFREWEFKDNIVSYSGTEAGGDIILGIQNSNGYAATGNLVLGNIMGESSGTLMTIFASNSATVIPRYITCNHNTVNTGKSSIIANLEGYASNPATQWPMNVTDFRSNIAWSDPQFDFTGPANVLGPYLSTCVVNALNPANNPLDWGFVPGAISHNASWRINAGYLTGGINWNLSVGAASNIFNQDPQFLDRTRHLDTFATLNGSTDTYRHQKFIFAHELFLTDVDKIAAAYAWIREGFQPQNEALRGSAHDGADRGAIPMAWSLTGNGVLAGLEGGGEIQAEWRLSGDGLLAGLVGSGELATEWPLSGDGILAGLQGGGEVVAEWVMAGNGILAGLEGHGVLEWEPPFPNHADPRRGTMTRKAGKADPNWLKRLIKRKA